MMNMVIIDCENTHDVEILMNKFAAEGMSVFVTKGIAMCGMADKKHREAHQNYRLHIEFQTDDLIGSPFPEDCDEYRNELLSAEKYFNIAFKKILHDTGLKHSGEYLCLSPSLYGLSLMP